ncbi:uncharacterized protein CDV56_103313 [Aspergillus thermomutatus]|uniref:Uncharacterized protein n=1 Tax=Aspergillus thermomutatus TaxID=41047 RepID=A0A397G1E6_ASPTH|nr:uncharacterized protein CDV56_103313 [Aspergillus thermomutatus]RHZ44851.1 hypothetical protein CDV56_103313 [Aspergillus thermomutatus]
MAYMSETTKNTRRSHWKGLNFAGTIDWAVDLQRFTVDDYSTDVLEPGAPKLENCTGTYTTFEAIKQDAAGFSDECRAQYVLQALQANLTGSLSRYYAMMADGYDEKFKTYADAVVQGSTKVVEEFMLDHGNEYFGCIVTKPSPAVTTAWECGQTRNTRMYICEPPKYRYRNVSQACPPDYSKRGEMPPAKGLRYSQSVYWTMNEDKAAQFWADLYSETGVAQEDITWENVHHYFCAPTEKHCGDSNWDYNFPVPKGFKREDVIDPRDVVTEAHGRLQDLKPQLDDAVRRVKEGTYLGLTDDLVDAVSLPIFMVADAVENMKSIVKVAEEMDREKRKAILFAFLSASFFFVPVVGEIVSGLTSLVTIGRIVALMGTVGNVALDIYTVVDDDKNAPLAIFNLILAPLALLDIARVSRAANFRRAMPGDELSKLGDKLAARMDMISRIKDRCSI